MNAILTPILSTLKSFSLSAQRSFDHTYRHLIGVPTLRFSEISPQLYLGGQYSARGYRILQKRGITAIVSMRMRAHKDLPDLGETQFLHLPTPDLHAPTLNDLHKGAAFIQDEIQNGGKVYVHCHYGEGRGPSMVAAYLMRTGLTLDDSIKQMRSVRSFIGLSKAQVERLKEFEAAVHKTTTTRSQTK